MNTNPVQNVQNTPELPAPHFERLTASDGAEVVIAFAHGDLKPHDMTAAVRKYDAVPRAIEGTSLHNSLASLITHANRTKVEGQSVAFVGDDAIRVLYDYDTPQRGKPGRRKHRAQYAFPKTDAFKVWEKVNGEEQSQEAFARLLEDRACDIAAPNMGPPLPGVRYASASDLAVCAEGLELTVEQQIVDRPKRRGDGRVEFTFKHSTTANKDGGIITVPTAFVLGLRIYEGGEPEAIAVRLSYRVAGASVLWTVDLHDLDGVLRAARDAAAAAFADATGLPVFTGTPEG